MFPHKLWSNGAGERATSQPDPDVPQFRMSDYGFGKEGVKVFLLRRSKEQHDIAEFTVTSHMRLNSHKEYYEADNSEVLGSDVQENLIYVHAQKKGIVTPEEFVLTLSQYFLDTFPIVAESHLAIRTDCWKRLGEDGNYGYNPGRTHNHAFAMDTNGQRFCEVVRTRKGERPLLMAGIRGLRICKTAKAPFVGYVKAGSLGTDGDHVDRILRFDVNATWQYNNLDTGDVDYDQLWQKVRNCIVYSFAGDPVDGVIITSVQYASYEAEKKVLREFPEICSISIDLPNYNVSSYDFSKFPALETKANVVVSTIDQTKCGIGYARLDRRSDENNKLLSHI